jgi:GNAT superfamily N-acetyltransferase
VLGYGAIEENLRATLAVFARAKAEGETRSWAGLTANCSAVDFSMFNAAILTAPAASDSELNRRIEIAAEFFTERRLPWSFWVCRDWLGQSLRASVEKVFCSHGLHLAMELPGMEAERLDPPSRTLPQLDYRPVEDEETRLAFSHIMSVTFGVPLTVAREIYASKNTWHGDLKGWVAYLNGDAVATAATLATPGVIGLYAVGTLPHQRRTGCAEAVVRYALDEAHAFSDSGRTVLESSDAGFHLYRRMGYRTITRYAIFARG